MTDIVIQVGDEQFNARLADDRAPDTVGKILNALPIESVARQWGNEIYFEIPVDVAEENAQATVRKGDLGYWPAGNCFCIFYGKTPMTTSEDEIVPASPVNVVGTVEDPDGFKSHSAGETVVVKLAD